MQGYFSRNITHMKHHPLPDYVIRAWGSWPIRLIAERYEENQGWQAWRRGREPGGGYGWLAGKLAALTCKHLATSNLFRGTFNAVTGPRGTKCLLHTLYIIHETVPSGYNMHLSLHLKIRHVTFESSIWEGVVLMNLLNRVHWASRINVRTSPEIWRIQRVWMIIWMWFGKSFPKME